MDQSLEIDAFLASLRACTRNKDLVTGTRIHDDLVQRGLLEKCSHALVLMYAKCGKLGKAKELLDMHMSSSNVVTWTALIAGYAQEAHGQNALDCFEQMQREGNLPDAVTYACIWKASQLELLERGNKSMMRLQGRGCCRMTLCYAVLSSGHVCQVRCCFKGATSARWAAFSMLSLGMH